MPGGEAAQEMSAFLDAVDVMLKGVYYTIEAALPALMEHGDGGAIVITSSIAGLSGVRTRFSAKSHGMPGYIAAKHGVVGLMRYYAGLLAEKNIRVNTVHPTGVATPMVVNDQVEQLLADQPEYAAAGKPTACSAHRTHRHERCDGLPLRPLGPIHHWHHIAGRRGVRGK